MKAELERLTNDWNSAWLQKDVTTVERLMADDYVYIAPSGQILDRRRILEILRSPSYRLYDGTRTEVVVRPVGQDTAIIVHRWRGTGTFEGASFTNDHRCTMVWVRRDGSWEVVLEQCSAIT